MKNSLLLILITILLTITSLSQNSTVEIYLPGAEEKSIQTYVIDDFITYQKKLIHNEKVDINAYWQGSFEIKETTYVIFELGHYQTGLYVEPETSYNLYSDTLFTKEEFRPFYAKEPLPLYFAKSDSLELNNLISDLNRQVDQFIEENFYAVYMERNNKLLDTLKHKLHQQYSQIVNPFFQNYLFYKIANISIAGQSVIKEKLFKENIENQPILYYHPEYMDYFNLFFDDFLLSGSNSIQRYDLLTAINYNRTYAALMDTLGKDTLLLGERIRELVMLKGLKELYYTEDFSKRDIKRILKETTKKSPFPEHKKIAANIVSLLTSLEEGQPAPTFELTNIISDTLVSMKDLIGKPVFLNFMTMKSFACQAEMEIIHDLHRNFQDSIKFITCCYFDDKTTWRKFITEKKYQWEFLWADEDILLRNIYRLKTLPFFILLDRDGRILELPARKPSENIEFYLQQLLIKK